MRGEGSAKDASTLEVLSRANAAREKRARRPFLEKLVERVDWRCLATLAGGQTAGFERGRRETEFDLELALELELEREM